MTSTTTRTTTGIAAIALLVLSTGNLAGCGAAGKADSSLSEQPPTEYERAIEESDLYKLVDDYLYIQNPDTGLNVLDVSNPDEPVMVSNLEEATGEAGELYVDGDRVLILFEQVSPSCTLPSEMGSWMIASTSQVWAVLSSTTDNPKVAGTYCLPGTMVSSRIVGDILYIVTSYSAFDDARTWLFSVDVSDPYAIDLVDWRVLEGEGFEIHVTPRTMYVAQQTTSDPTWWDSGTWIRYIDISDADGVMQERGDIVVEGLPLTRFHMDEYGSTFRIVTFTSRWAGSNLHVIDVSDPDHLTLMGSINHLAPDEDLHATRFVEDKAYIVTYEPVILNTDPLWVVSLEDPTRPTLLGHLEIPGWSDYIFPRGDQLLAVGRGDRGARIAASLFDVSDPTDPRELQRLEFGTDEATSEANSDFRGVRVVDDGTFGELSMMAVPYTDNIWQGGSCTPHHWLQLIDILDDDLELRGRISQEGLIRRTVPIGNKLYAITDRRVAAVDVTDRDAPFNHVAVDIGDPSIADQCTATDIWIDPDPWIDDDVGFTYFPFGCSMSSTPAPSAIPVALILLGLGLAALAFRRR